MNKEYNAIMKKRPVILVSVLLTGSVMFTSGFAGWQDLLKEADSLIKGTTETSQGSSATSSLSNQQIAQGLKEALNVGVKKAINMLGKENGFLKDQSVRIPMPEQLQKVESTLRSFGQDKMADEFVTSMNRAAEQAVPEVSNIFINSISKMSLSDAQNILQGGDTAATDYFKQHTSQDLAQLIKPYVNKAMDSNQVTQYYKAMVSQVKSFDSFGMLDSYLGNAAELDEYVTDKTMQGLFTKIAEQEKLIRDNPAARSTELLKQVFGSIVK